MPTLTEARLLADIRCTVADILDLSIQYRDAESVRERYAQLMALRGLTPAKPTIAHAVCPAQLQLREREE